MTSRYETWRPALKWGAGHVRSCTYHERLDLKCFFDDSLKTAVIPKGTKKKHKQKNMCGGRFLITKNAPFNQCDYNNHRGENICHFVTSLVWPFFSDSRSVADERGLEVLMLGSLPNFPGPTSWKKTESRPCNSSS